MPLDDINNIRRKIAEVDAELKQVNTQREQLFESRRFLEEQRIMAETKMILEIAAATKEAMNGIKNVQVQISNIEREKKESAGHFAVLMRIVNAIIDTRIFVTAKEWAKAANVSYGSIFNNMIEIEKMIAQKGLKLIIEKTKNGTTFRVL
ncbi:MAG: hypothetical protein EPO62_06495 [Candidatus Nitrosotenuis sp.]|nr:MAG: hypothetical protein EPO62_06495 [Candidatus Nitrosotenuis sp.]